MRESSETFGKPRCSNSYFTHAAAYLTTHFVARRQPPGQQLFHLSLEPYSVSLVPRSEVKISHVPPSAVLPSSKATSHRFLLIVVGFACVCGSSIFLLFLPDF